jgi:hypothetical protein
MSDGMQQNLYLFRQNYAFSTGCLDYKIPDFRQMIDETIPVSFSGSDLEVITKVNSKRIPPDKQLSFFRDVVEKRLRLICNDVVSLHCKLMERFGSEEDAKTLIWELTDHCLVWDLLLLEQRIAWATSGTIISYATAFGNINSYTNENGVRSYRPVLRTQFEKLIGELPFLNNDIAGQRVFREKEFSSPYFYCIS